MIKISGELLGNTYNNGQFINSHISSILCHELKKIYNLGIQIGLVIGGGNIFRGLSAKIKLGISRSTGDYMGMLGTIINGLALMDLLEQSNIPVCVQSAIDIPAITEPFIRKKAIDHMQKGRLVIFVAGTGNPFFSTDTTAALRAAEINAQIIMKVTKVDGIYNKDPNQFSDAFKYNHITYWQALESKIKVMDLTAFTLCMDNNIPILVFNMEKSGIIQKAVMGDHTIGTLVSSHL